jgi:hypothetical protein
MATVFMLANDSRIEQLIVALESVKRLDPESTIVVVPYDEHITLVRKICKTYKVEFQEPPTDAWLELPHVVYGRSKGLMKKLCYFEFDVDIFLSLDIDAIYFAKIADLFHFKKDELDLLYLDTSFDSVYDQRTSEIAQRSKFFNTGFFISSRHNISMELIFSTIKNNLSEYQNIAYLLTGDQPALNYVVDKNHLNAVSLAEIDQSLSSATWHLNPEIQKSNEKLIDIRNNRAVVQLHYAGAGRISRGVNQRFGDIFDELLYSGMMRCITNL